MAIRYKDESQIELVSKNENDQIARSVVILVNSYPDLPVDIVRYEQIEETAPSMTISAIQATYKVEEFITGTYIAEFPFKILYRISPGRSMDKRLEADELLNNIGDWLTKQTANLGEGKTFLGISRDTQSVIEQQYSGGEEDHQIFLTLQYKVNLL